MLEDSLLVVPAMGARRLSTTLLFLYDYERNEVGPDWRHTPSAEVNLDKVEVNDGY